MLEIEEYALLNHIPIMQKEGILFLKHFIEKHNITRILELGSAIGYSALQMAMVGENVYVKTIERDDNRYQEAVKNIKKFGKENQITILHDDIFNVTLEESFDLIFIDAAKSQNIKFFDKFKNNLLPNGYIITDNINFHSLTTKMEEIKSKNLRAMCRKINEYVEYLKSNNEFHTDFFKIGDGISISYRG